MDDFGNEKWLDDAYGAAQINSVMAFFGLVDMENRRTTLLSDNAH